MYTTMCEVASGKLLYNTQGPAWCSVMTQRDRMGGVEGSFKSEGIYIYIYIYIFTPLGLEASLVTQTVKNPLAMQET